MFVRTMIVIYSEQRIRHYVYNIYINTQGFPFQMKLEANGLLQVATIWAWNAHFSAKGSNLTAGLHLVYTGDWTLHRRPKSSVAGWNGKPWIHNNSNGVVVFIYVALIYFRAFSILKIKTSQKNNMVAVERHSIWATRQLNHNDGKQFWKAED